MNAVVLREAGAPEVLRIDTVPDPVPGPGEVVVALRAAALNRRDVFLRKGIAPSPLPVIPGSDGAGAVRELAGGGGVDVVVDSVGSTWAQSIATLRPGGRAVVFGGTGGDRVELTVRPVTLGQVSLLGTTMGSPRDFAGLLAAVRHQDWAPVIDSVRPLAEAAAAHQREEAGEHFGKLVLSIA